MCNTVEDDKSSGEEELDTKLEEEFPELVKDTREAVLAGRSSRATIIATEIKKRRIQIQ